MEPQSEQSKKYDRQLRLWGANGQKALMEARVLLLGAGPAGTETLKNLVLPGVGRVVVVDDEHVTAADLGNNFFLDSGCLGKKRAEISVPASADQKEIEALAFEDAAVQTHTSGKTIRKVIVVPGRIINIVVS